MSIKGCSHCLKHPEKVQVCTGCNLAHYCDRDCQKAGWSSHKQYCALSQQYPTEASKMQEGFMAVRKNAELLVLLSCIAYHNMLVGYPQEVDSNDHPQFVETRITDYSSPDNLTISAHFAPVIPENAKTHSVDMLNIPLRYHSDIPQFNNPVILITVPIDLVKSAYADLSQAGDVSEYTWPAIIVVKDGRMFAIMNGSESSSDVL